MNPAELFSRRKFLRSSTAAMAASTLLPMVSEGTLSMAD
jgi:hypothetical protein